MTRLRQILHRLGALFRRGQLDADMAEEMRLHLEQRIERNLAAGMGPDEARYAAQRSFGGAEQLKECAREERAWVWFEQLRQDFRYGIRSLRRAPLFTSAAGATLALGIGANTAVFSVFHTTLLRPLPYPESDRLVALWERNPQTGDRNVVSAGNYLDWEEQNTVFEAIGAYAGVPGTINGEGPAYQVSGARLTTSLFDLLQIPPMLGRGFRPGLNAEAGGREVLLSHRLWQTRYGGRDDVVGRILLFGETPMTVIGVMPPKFQFPSPDVDFWFALRSDPSDRESRRTRQFRVLGRLKPGVTLAGAQAEMNVIAQRIATSHPEFMAGWGALVRPYRSDLVASSRPSLLILGGIVSAVLLVACANVANLLLARATSRQRELAIRGALGAGRSRLMRQLLTEAVLLAGLGTGAGLMIACGTVDFLAVLAPTQLAGIVQPSVDLGAIGFAATAMLAATGIVGLAPAWWMSRVDLRAFLHGGRSNGQTLNRARGTLLVIQIALATTLLVGAGLLLRSMANLHRTDLGFDPQKLLTANSVIWRTRYPTITAQGQYLEKLRPSLAAIPGVEAVTFTADPPVGSWGTFSYVIAGKPRPGPNPREEPIEMRAIASDYFQVLGIPLLAGRTFDSTDRGQAPTSAIVNHAFAQRHFPDGNVVGQRLSFEGHNGPWYEIVGLCGDTKDAGLEEPAAPAIYVPYLQKRLFNMSDVTAILRTTGDPSLIREDVRQAFMAVDAESPARRITPLSSLYLARLSQRTFLTKLTTGFALLTLTVGVIGVYGVISYSVAQRRREFGIQLALGATPARIVRHVLNSGLKLIAIGALLGGGAALTSAKLLGNLLYEIEPLDPITLFGVVGLLGSVSLLALWLPARTASKSDPMVALRCE